MNQNIFASELSIALTQNYGGQGTRTGEEVLTGKYKRSWKRMLFGALVCFLIFPLMVIGFLGSEPTNAPDGDSFWEMAVNSAVPTGDITPVSTPVRLPAQMVYDPAAPYLVDGTLVLHYTGSEIVQYWRMPIDTNEFHLKYLYHGIIVYQKKAGGITKAFDLPTRTEISLPSGPFTTEALGINANGAVVLKFLSENYLNNKIVAINKEGEEEWKFSGECSGSASKEPQLVAFYACQNYQTPRQEGGWVLDASTGALSRPPLRPGERIRALESELYIISASGDSVFPLSRSGSVGAEETVPVGLLDLVSDNENDNYVLRYHWNLYSLETMIDSGLSIDNVGDKYVLSSGLVIEPKKKPVCESAIFLDEGRQYICGKVDDFSKATNVGVQGGITFYQTDTNDVIVEISGAGTLLRLDRKLFLARRGAFGETHLIALNKESDNAES